MFSARDNEKKYKYSVVLLMVSKKETTNGSNFGFCNCDIIVGTG